jgi:hypothetical protein
LEEGKPTEDERKEQLAPGTEGVVTLEVGIPRLQSPVLAARVYAHRVEHHAIASGGGDLNRLRNVDTRKLCTKAHTQKQV